MDKEGGAEEVAGEPGGNGAGFVGGKLCRFAKLGSSRKGREASF